MPSGERKGSDLALPEARRLMTICNACRYCEGFCAVFPAMERRAVFEDQDLLYLANLCHDCRGCFYACQYAPPHEFGVNVPRVFAQLRRETYERHTWPRSWGRAFRRNGVTVALVASLATALAALLALVLVDPGVLSSTHTGPGAFYEVVPYPVMVLPASVIMVFASLALLVGGARFWRESGGRADAASFLTALGDALRLTYLGGGGDGCNYPEERFSNRRRWLHHFVFWGFALDFASTSAAAFYEHVLHRVAPYPLWSVPVALGTVGGLMLAFGTVGLLALKRGSDRDPADSNALGSDHAFLVMLLLTSATGLALLALRETAAMGALLLVHLGVVAGLFMTLPYGKFVHAIYRYLALVRYAEEERSERSA